MEEGGGEEVWRKEEGSIEESGWSARTMAGLAVNRPEELDEELEELESTEEDEERTEEEEEKRDEEDPGGGPQTTPLELGVGPPAVWDIGEEAATVTPLMVTSVGALMSSTEGLRGAGGPGAGGRGWGRRGTMVARRGPAGDTVRDLLRRVRGGGTGGGPGGGSGATGALCRKDGREVGRLTEDSGHCIFPSLSKGLHRPRSLPPFSFGRCGTAGNAGMLGRVTSCSLRKAFTGSLAL